MLVRPVMKRLFCLKAKNGLIITKILSKIHLDITTATTAEEHFTCLLYTSDAADE